MRIVGGTHRSRQFNIPENLGIRPTTDFAREAIFNILHNRVDLEGMTVLDLFGGGGGISFEFSSRGCASITTIEKNPKACEFIKTTARNLKLENIKVIKADVFTFLKTCAGTFDIIFADPPFKLENIARIPALVFEKKLLNENGILVVEHPSDTDFSQLNLVKEGREYGTINFSIFNQQQPA